MKSFAFSLLMVGVVAMLPQHVQAQEVAQAMPGMEMKKDGGEMKSDTKMASMSCCCSKKDDTAKKAEATAKPTR